MLHVGTRNDLSLLTSVTIFLLTFFFARICIKISLSDGCFENFGLGEMKYNLKMSPLVKADFVFLRIENYERRNVSYIED